jgi:hypothetical protein
MSASRARTHRRPDPEAGRPSCSEVGISVTGALIAQVEGSEATGWTIVPHLGIGWSLEGHRLALAEVHTQQQISIQAYTPVMQTLKAKRPCRDADRRTDPHQMKRPFR